MTRVVPKSKFDFSSGSRKHCDHKYVNINVLQTPAMTIHCKTWIYQFYHWQQTQPSKIQQGRYYTFIMIPAVRVANKLYLAISEINAGRTLLGEIHMWDKMR